MAGAPSSAQEAQWKDQAKAEEVSQRAILAAMPAQEVSTAVQKEAIEPERQRELEAVRGRGPSTGIGM